MEILYGVDQWTLVIAIVGVFIRPTRKWFSPKRPCWSASEAFKDFLNSATIVPFITLFFAVFVPHLLDEITKSSKVTFGLAGGVGVIFVMRELLVMNGARAPNS